MLIGIRKRKDRESWIYALLNDTYNNQKLHSKFTESKGLSIHAFLNVIFGREIQEECTGKLNLWLFKQYFLKREYKYFSIKFDRVPGNLDSCLTKRCLYKREIRSVYKRIRFMPFSTLFLAEGSKKCKQGEFYSCIFKWFV